jgi:hypothetical protein
MLAAAPVAVHPHFSASVDRVASSTALRSDLRSRFPEEFQSTADDELVRRLINLWKRRNLLTRKPTGV